MSTATEATVPLGLSVPVGTILPFGGNKQENPSNLPAGWLYCDGTSYAVLDYPDLFNVIGNNWGGDGGANFNVPDLRGYFLRGVDEGTGVDPEADSRLASCQFPDPPTLPGNTGDNPGSYEPDQVGPHMNQFPEQYSTDNANVPLYAGYSMNNILGGYLGGNAPAPSTLNVSAPCVPTLQETTVRNKYVYFIICASASS